MRLTYSSILSAHLRNIGKSGITSSDGDYTNLVADFQYNLGNRYQMIFSKIAGYINQDTETASTVASQQYYYYPVGTISVDSAQITIGSMKYTLSPIYDQNTWNWLNSLAIQPTSIPQFIFPRKDDFGIWPIPQDVYTITFQRFFRDRNLLVADYTTGSSVTVTNGSVTVTGVATSWTDAMIGRWFTITDTTVRGHGYWYRIATVPSTTSMTLETYWASSTASVTGGYIIGESPEIPEEAHVLLPAGTAADYYSGLRNDPSNATMFNNEFWTGDKNNNVRDFDSKNVAGGLIGMVQKYKDRTQDNIVQRQPKLLSPTYKVFAETLS